MRLRDVLLALEQIAPLRHAESWDNVGLIAGDPAAPVTRALLAIDATAAVADEAARERCELIVAYHPPVFEGMKSVPATSLVHRAIRDGIALYSPHTALDVAPGGTNDLLADVLGLGARAALKPAPPRETSCKLVALVPVGEVDRAAQALFDAGAGATVSHAEYVRRSPETGTLGGGEGVSGGAGEGPGRTPLARLEATVPLARQEAVIEALRAALPGEELPFEIVRLVARADGTGIGRAGVLPAPVPRGELIERIKRGLGVQALLVAGPTAGEVTRVAVCAGAGRGLLNEALARKTELYLTGELPHHDALRAAAAGMTVVCALHSNSERATLPRVKARLEELVPGLEVRISQEDRDPFTLE